MDVHFNKAVFLSPTLWGDSDTEAAASSVSFSSIDVLLKVMAQGTLHVKVHGKQRATLYMQYVV